MRIECERENSATGHIGFLEFINAAALPLARNLCNIEAEPILYSILHAASLSSALSILHPRDIPPHQPTQDPRPARPAKQLFTKAIEAGHRIERCRQSTCERNRGAASQLHGARAERNSVDYGQNTRT